MSIPYEHQQSMSRVDQKQHQVEQQPKYNLSFEQARLHREALKLSRNHRHLEAEIIDVLLKVESSKLYKVLQYTSLFSYTVGALGFSEAVSYSFISVMRKAREISDLREAISQCEVSVSKIQRVMPVINSKNAKELITFAKAHTNREIEREVARMNPKTGSKDREIYLNEKFVQLTISLPEGEYKKLKKAQNLESQRTAKACSIPDTLGRVLDFYLERKDPVQKAYRAQQRTEKKERPENSENSDKTDKTEKAEKTEKTQRPEKFKSAISGSSVPDSSVPDSSVPSSSVPSSSVPSSSVPSSPVPGAAVPESADKLVPGEVRSKRRPLTAEEKHGVTRRDGFRCAHVDAQNRRCQNEKWLEIHHVRPVSKGGRNELENLVTLCSQHHDLVHQYSLPLEGQVSWIRSPVIKYVSSLIRLT